MLFFEWGLVNYSTQLTTTGLNVNTLNNTIKIINRLSKHMSTLIYSIPLFLKNNTIPSVDIHHHV